MQKLREVLVRHALQQNNDNKEEEEESRRTSSSSSSSSSAAAAAAAAVFLHRISIFEEELKVKLGSVVPLVRARL
jgi:hypothetical protein